MQSTLPTRMRRTAIAIAAVLMSACGLDKQTQPSLIGPADTGQSIQLTAVPDQLPRDGSSQSVITVVARDSSNRPLVGQRLILSLGGGTPTGVALSQTEVTTNSQGTATFSVSAPTSGSMGNSIVVVASPVGTNADNMNTRILSIAVNPANSTAPTASFTWTPSSPDMGQTVTFDATGTTDEGAACGSCSFAWDFGDSTTGSGRVVTHGFSAAGTYVVTLTATDSVGTSGSATRTVTVSATTIPTGIGVTSSPNPPIAKQAATFTAAATAAPNHHIVSYQFIWGDGDTNTTASNVIQHTYSQSGSYLITLTVRDDLGQSSTGNTVITVSSGLTPSFNVTKAGTTVTFDASATTSSVASTITDYAWDFETDGTYDTNGSSPVVSHDYGSNGTYRVTLRVTDSRGVTATTSQTITLP